MKLFFFTDPHNSDVAPRMRTSDYTSDILDKQEQILSFCRSEKANFVVCGGDVFHTKNPSQISHRLVNRLMEIYREFPETFIVAGNHDYQHSLDEIKDNPLGLFNHLPNVEVLNHFVHWTFDSVVMMFYPFTLFHETKDWYQAFGSIRASYKELKRKIQKPVVLFTHAPLSTKEFPFEVIYYSDMEPLADCVYCGHLHNLQETTPSFCNPGSLSRGVLNLDESFDRSIGMTQVVIEDGQIANLFCPLDVKLPELVFKVEKATTKVGTVQAVADFLEHITDMEIPRSLDKDELMAEIRKMDIDDGTKYKAIAILESV